MNDWPLVTLGDLIHVKHGYAFKGEFFADEGDKLVLKPGNFPMGGGIRLRPGKDVFYTGSFPPEFELSPGDMLVVMTDLTQAAPILGSPAVIPDRPVMLHNQRLGLVQVRPGVAVDRRYLYYALLSDTSRSQIRATATGATVRHTAPERIYRVSLPLPDISSQQLIGDLLGSMDDLIENSRRRVQVLEETVRVIYREWFVRFRYPGRKDVPVAHTDFGPLPSGWAVRYLGDDLPFRQCKRKIAPYEGERSYLATADVTELHSKSAGMALDFKSLPSRAQLQPEDNTIFTARMSGYRKVLLYPEGSSELSTDVLSSGFLGIRCDPGWFSYVAATISDPSFERLITRFATGATQVSLTDGGARQIPWVIPTLSEVSRFEEAAAPIFAQVLALHRSIKNLTALRDLMLPSLVSGRVDLSALASIAPSEGQVA